MRHFAVCSLLVLSGFGNNAYGQQPVTPVPRSTAPTASSAAPAPGVPPPPNTLLDGTAVKLRLAETISSSNAKVGQQVPFEVTDDVVVQGVTVLAKGAQAIASVTDASPKKSMGRG